MKFKGCVEIQWDKCREKDVPRIKNILPIFEWFSKIAKVRIIVNVPRGYAKKIKSEDDKTVHIHVNAWPKARAINHIFHSGTLFWTKSPKNLRMFEPINPVASFGIFVNAPEPRATAFVSEKNIWLMFDCLNDGWKKENLAKILFFTLYLAMQHAVNLDGRLIARLVRKNFLEQRNEIGQKLRLFLEENYIGGIKEVSNTLAKSAENIEKEKKEFLKLLNEEIDIETMLEYAKSGTDRNELAKSFHLILNLDGVETVEVGSAGLIIVNTKVIFKTPNAEGLESTHFDIGKFEIRIDPRLKDRSGIHFHQDRYAGEYYHGYAKEKETCFGQSVSDGLNHIMNKHMQDLNIVAIVELCLSFLRKESNIPQKRFLENVPAPENYASPEAMDEAKKRFIEAMENAFYNRKTLVLQSELDSLRKEITDKQAVLMGMRREFKDTRDFHQKLGKELRIAEHKAEKELDKLANDRDVVCVEKNGPLIEIYLSVPKLFDACVIMKPNGHPRLLCSLSSDKSRKGVFDPSLSQSIELSDAQMIKLQRDGKIHEFISLVKQFLTELAAKQENERRRRDAENIYN